MLSDRSIEVSNDSALQLVIGRKITSRRKEYAECMDNQYALKKNCYKVNRPSSANDSQLVYEDIDNIAGGKSLIIV